MSSFKTSYILNKNEAMFLLGSFREAAPSRPALYIIETYLRDSDMPQAAVEGLLYKKLAKKSFGEIVLEPVVDLLVRSALSSEALWVADFEEADGAVLILESKDIYLHIRRYPHISDAWKITPYQSKRLLSGEFEGLTILKAVRIDLNGNREILDRASWVAEWYRV